MNRDFKLKDAKITELIIDNFSKNFKKNLDVDVAVVGAGPAGMTAARYLSKEGYEVVLFERKLSIGGGMWGGGMTFPTAVIQSDAKAVVEETGVELEEKDGYYLADSVELATKTASSAIDAGTKIFNNITVEDAVIREEKEIEGLVINWSSVVLSQLHVDPLSINSDVVIEASGHDCEFIEVLKKKIPEFYEKYDGEKEIGESSMWAEKGEEKVVENTKEVYPNVIVAGMAANAVFNSPRMGPIFGGMFLSGKKAAEEAKKILEE